MNTGVLPDVSISALAEHWTLWEGAYAALEISSRCPQLDLGVEGLGVRAWGFGFRD